MSLCLLGWVLAVQALAPLLFATLPSTIAVLGAVIGIVPSGIGTKIFIATVPNLQPVTNVLLTMLLIKPYRRAVLEMVEVCGIKSQVHTQVMTAVTQHSQQHFVL